jgi:hypothetical protein
MDWMLALSRLAFGQGLHFILAVTLEREVFLGEEVAKLAHDLEQVIGFSARTDWRGLGPGLHRLTLYRGNAGTARHRGRACRSRARIDRP